MPAGRPRKPTNLAVLHGDRSDRVNRDEPQPGGELAAPDYLSAEARRVWDRLAPDREAKGVLTAWDVDAFAAFCEAVVLIRLGVRDTRRRPVPGAPSPMSRFKDAVAIAATLGGKFGWTPSDRAKLNVGSGGEPDDAERLLS